MRLAATPRRCVSAFLCGSIFFLCWELAAQSAFGLLELSLLGLAVSLAVGLLRLPRREWLPLLREAVQWGRPGFWLVASAALYLLVDLAVAFYSPAPGLMLQKYKLVVAMLPVTAAILLLGNCPEALERVRWMVALASVGVCLMAVVNHFWLEVYPRYYDLRLSLRADYNMFATVVYMGMVTGVCGALRRKKTPWKKLAGALFFLLPALVVISRSASRRIVLALLVTLPVLLWAALWSLRPLHRKKLLALAAALACAGLLAWAGDAGLEAAMSRQLETGRRPGAAVLTPGGETTAAERMATMADGSMFSKRRVIWGLALEELSRFGPAEWLWGRGGGYDILLYDKIGPPLDSVYPDRAARQRALSAHNLLLADLLNGGLLKLLSFLPLVAVTAWLALRRTLADPPEGLPLALGLGLCLLNSLISNRFGLLYDRYFYLLAALLAVGPHKTQSTHREEDR